MISLKAAAKARVVASSITDMLTTPTKVAHALDWRQTSGGAILSLRILKERIELAVASHPALEEPTLELPSIPLRTSTTGNRKVLDAAVSRELAQTVHKFNVCGMVVSWPVQREGWCGKSCGQVLHTLDQIQALAQKPVCLYDPEHSAPPEDEWGRATIYAEASDKTLHVASEEQYEHSNADGKVAVDIWNDFCKEHWPQLYHKPQPIQISRAKSSSRDETIYGDKDHEFYGARLQAAF